MKRGVNDINIEQFICMVFVPIGLLLGGIRTCERNYLFGIENYLTKFNKKYNVNIDKNTYCRFQGMHTIKNATSLLILDVMLFLFEAKELKTIIIILCIWGIVSQVLYNRKRKKLIKNYLVY